MRHLPYCAKVGCLHGLIGGPVFGFLRLHMSAPTITEIAWSMLAITLVVTVVTLFIQVAVLRYSFASVAWQTFVNAVIVTTLAVLVIQRIPVHPFLPVIALVIGVVVGILVGVVLCRMCGRYDLQVSGVR
jgi:hypothetical protein